MCIVINVVSSEKEVIRKTQYCIHCSLLLTSFTRLTTSRDNFYNLGHPLIFTRRTLAIQVYCYHYHYHHYYCYY